jgi:Flp pilus assembly pilin Flp
MRFVVKATRQRGAQVVEYCLLIAVLSIALVLALPRLGNGICELNNRVGGLLGAASFSCAAGANNGPGSSGAGNGGAGNSGAGNNGGGNNAGDGTNGGANNNGGGNGPGGNSGGGGNGVP